MRSQTLAPVRGKDGEDAVKNSKTCPKCQSTDITRIPGDVRAFGAGNSILIGGTLFPKFVLVTRYLCGAYGFTEEWIDPAEDITKLKEVFGTGLARRISTKLYWRNLAFWIVILLVLFALLTVFQPGFR
jgi:hypothetical protein